MVYNFRNAKNNLPITTAIVIKFEAVVVIPEIGKKQNKSNRRHSIVIRNAVLAKQEANSSRHESKSKHERATIFRKLRDRK